MLIWWYLILMIIKTIVWPMTAFYLKQKDDIFLVLSSSPDQFNTDPIHKILESKSLYVWLFHPSTLLNQQCLCFDLQAITVI